MEDLFKGPGPEGEECDLQIFIFPHLKEFMTVDLRYGDPIVNLLHTQDIFTDRFYAAVEHEFSIIARRETNSPFSHLINLPLRMEEIIRDISMSFILDTLGIDPDDEESVPSVVVFVVSGGALAVHSERLIDNLNSLIGSEMLKSHGNNWENVLSRLVSQENEALNQINRDELSEAFGGDSHDYFTLWENRN